MIDLVCANDSMLALDILSKLVTDLPSLADHESIILTISEVLVILLEDFLLSGGLPSMKGSSKKYSKRREGSWNFWFRSFHVPSIINWMSLQLGLPARFQLPWRHSQNKYTLDPSGHRWWNQECSGTVRALRSVTGDPASTPDDIRKAKWQNYPEAVSATTNYNTRK